MNFTRRLLLIAVVGSLASLRPVGALGDSAGETQRLLESGPVQIGGKAPGFGGWSSKNRVVSLARLMKPKSAAPSRGVILSFFATHCVPCRKGLPVLAGVSADLGPSGVPVVLVAVGERAEKFSPFLASLGVDLMAIEDRFGKISQRYGVTGGAGTGTIPRTFVLDSEGKVQAILGREGPDFAEILRGFFPVGPVVGPRRGGRVDRGDRSPQGLTDPSMRN